MAAWYEKNAWLTLATPSSAISALASGQGVALPQGDRKYAVGAGIDVRTRAANRFVDQLGLGLVKAWLVETAVRLDAIGRTGNVPRPTSGRPRARRTPG